MDKWYVGFYKLSKILLVAVLIGMTLNVTISPRAFADDGSNPNDGGDGDDTDFARTAIVRIQI